jgi:hypothetical protein
MVLVYLWGTWGGGVFGRRCLPLATVCDCPQWGRYGRACREPAKVVIFEGFARRDMYSFVAGVALGDIPTCEIACRKSLCVTGAILLNDFRKITVQWHWCGFVRRVWHVATFPRVDDMCRKSFCVTGEILLNDFRKITVIFCGKRSTSEMSISCGRHRALYVWCCVYLQIILELLMYPHQMAKGQRTHSIQWLQ